jgi:hypothetical protein
VEAEVPMIWSPLVFETMLRFRAGKGAAAT